jgi:glycosyltransferase involved in cell wall biosynthesis
MTTYPHTDHEAPPRKIRLLLVIDTLGEEAGTERYAAEVIQGLDKSRFEVHVCCLFDSPRLRELAAHCASTRVFPVVSVYRPAGLWQISRIRRYINAQAIDIVHTLMPKATIAGGLAAAWSRCGTLVTSRRSMGYWYTPGALRLLRYVNRRTTRVLANAERVKQFVSEMEGIPPQKIDVLHNGVDLSRFEGTREGSAADGLGIPKDAPVVGIVANYRPVKDLGLFLRAAQIVAAEAPDAAFLLVGQGPLRDELGRLAAELGIGSRVFFSEGKGSVPDFLKRMSVGCLCSHSEGFSNAILEYMAAGLPAVATDAGGNAEAIEDGVTGYVVRTRDPEAFARPILRLLSDETLRGELGRRSLERCRDRFEIGAAVRRLERYYLDLIDLSVPRSREWADAPANPGDDKSSI